MTAGRLAPLLAGAVVLAVALATIVPAPVGVFWDDGVYAVTGRALAAGEGYRFTHLPGAPPAVHYPPGYPALLALVFLATPPFPDNVAWLKLVNPLCLAAAAAAATAFGARVLALPPWVAAVAVGLGCAFAPVLLMTNTLLSEPFFLATLVPALWAADRASARADLGAAVVAGVAAGAVSYVRTAGIVLVPALALALAGARRPRAAVAALAAAALVIAPWVLWSGAAAARLPAPLRGRYGPYLEWVLDGYARGGAGAVWATAHANAAEVARSVAVVLSVGPLRVARWGLFALFVAGLALAAWRLRTRAPATLWFVGGYLTLVVLWPYAPGRFLFAVWPLLCLVVAAGWVARGEGIPAPPPRAVGAAALAAIATGLAVYDARGLARGWWRTAPETQGAFAAALAQWAATATAPGDLVAADAHLVVHLYSGRPVVPVSLLTTTERTVPKDLRTMVAELDTIVRTFAPQWVAIGGNSPELAAAESLAARAVPPRLEQVAALAGGGRAYRVVPR